MKIMKVTQRKAPVTWERIITFFIVLCVIAVLLATTGCAVSTRVDLDQFSFYAKRIGMDDD